MTFVFAGVAFAACLWWVQAMHHRMRPRTLDTALPPDAVRALFRATVAGWSWNLQEDGDRMVARSSLLTGIARQRIGLTVWTSGARTGARVEVVSYEGQWIGVPQSPYTVLWRLDSFVDAVRAEDLTARVTVGS